MIRFNCIPSDKQIRFSTRLRNQTLLNSRQFICTHLDQSNPDVILTSKVLTVL